MTQVLLSTITWALLATMAALIAGVPLAYLLARKDFPGKGLTLALVSLPMVLPPTAVGYLLLQTFSQRGMFPFFAHWDILFTWKGVVVACAVMAFPLVVRTAKVAFEGVNPELEDMASTLGYGKGKIFLTITVPNAWRGLVASGILGFTRAMGEFGATMMVAGNIPGKTQTLSSALYIAQQSGDQKGANLLLITAILLGMSAVLISEKLVRQNPKHKGIPYASA